MAVAPNACSPAHCSDFCSHSVFHRWVTQTWKLALTLPSLASSRLLLRSLAFFYFLSSFFFHSQPDNNHSLVKITLWHLLERYAYASISEVNAVLLLSIVSSQTDLSPYLDGTHFLDDMGRALETWERYCFYRV